MQFHSFSTVRYTGSFYQDYLDQGNSCPFSRRKVKRLQLLLLLNLPLLLDSSSTPPPLLLSPYSCSSSTSTPLQSFGWRNITGFP